MESRLNTEEKLQPAQNQSMLQQLYSGAKQLGNYTAELVLGDLWKASSHDGTGIGQQVALAAERSERNPHHTSLRFFTQKVHYIHPQHVPHILQNEDKVYGHNVSGLFRKVFGEKDEGDNIFVIPSHHPEWKQLRTHYLTHLFTDSALTKLADPIHTIVNKYLDEITEEKGNAQIKDVEMFSARLTMEIIAHTPLGFLKFPKETQEKFSLVINEITKKMANPIHNFSGIIGKGIEWFDKYLFGEKTLDELVRPGYETLNGLIKLNEESILKNNNWIKNISMERERKRRGISDETWTHALNAWITYIDKEKARQEKGIDDENADHDLKEQFKIAKDILYSSAIKNAISLFLVVGHETSAKFFQYTLTFLADPDHADVVKKLREELQNYLAKSQKSLDQLTKHDMHQLIYLKAVMQESLRLRPPIPILNGMFTESFYVDGIGMLRKGDMFIISMLHTHQNELVFKDATKFNPDRFIDERTGHFKQPTPGTFLPFGFKIRECVGQNLAQLEVGLAITKMLDQFTFKIDGPHPELYKETVPMISLKPKHKICLTGISRKEEQLALRNR